MHIEVKQLAEWNEPNGEGCVVSDKITREGYKVGYMFREEPNPNYPDSTGTRYYPKNDITSGEYLYAIDK